MGGLILTTPLLRMMLRLLPNTMGLMKPAAETVLKFRLDRSITLQADR